MYMYCIYTHISISNYIYKKELMENSNLRLFAANRKWKLVFFGRQKINDNRHLLFQQMCLSLQMFSSMPFIHRNTLGNMTIVVRCVLFAFGILLK